MNITDLDISQTFFEHTQTPFLSPPMGRIIQSIYFESERWTAFDMGHTHAHTHTLSRA